MQSLTELKGEIDSNIIIVVDFHTPLWVMDRTARQTVNKEAKDLNNTVCQLDLTDIYRILHPTKQNTHSSQNTQNILQDRAHVRLQNKS